MFSNPSLTCAFHLFVCFSLHSSSFPAVVIATVSVKPRGVSRVCFSQRDAEIPSSRFVTANGGAPRGRPPRRETGSSNSLSVAVHLSGSAPLLRQPGQQLNADVCVSQKPPIDLGGSENHRGDHLSAYQAFICLGS